MHLADKRDIKGISIFLYLTLTLSLFKFTLGRWGLSLSQNKINILQAINRCYKRYLHMFLFYKRRKTWFRSGLMTHFNRPGMILIGWMLILSFLWSILLQRIGILTWSVLRLSNISLLIFFILSFDLYLYLMDAKECFISEAINSERNILCFFLLTDSIYGFFWAIWTVF